MTKTPEPEDKLDAATTVAVNGPEDAPFDWRQIDWRRMEDEVRRLRQRIFTASKAGDLARVRNLQKLMLRSRANTLLSVRRVTERNAGRLTAGVDGEVVLTPEAKARLVERIEHPTEPFKAWPVRRVYIPKPGSHKRRPLGIPVIADRAHQARVVNALEPEWEARFEPRSYGFRPGRGCHDAIEAVYHAVKGKDPKRRWALDADLAGAFDRIAHDHILSQLGTFPARGMVAQWLKAGVFEQGRLQRTEEGTPQGGVVSPVLLNVALHGIEKAAGVRYYPAGQRAGRIVAAGSPTLIRYADDLVALCPSRQEALEVKARLADWLAPRGLSFNEDKTRVVSLDEGFDFLGFNVRRYGAKSLIKPSNAAQRRIRKRLRDELRSLRGTNAQAVIKRLNPIIRGWAATTGHRSPARCSTRWITTCGGWSTNGPGSATRTSRRPGSFTGTSACSTNPDRTGGCSATVTAAPTCTSSSGPRSADTRSSWARRHQTTPPSPNTGPAGGAKRPCRSTRPPSG
jgi:RNA-directed DNA polymerase